MRKRVLVAVSLAFVTGVGYLGLRPLFASPNQINEASYAKIEKGMTKDEVSLLLGGPAGDYSSQLVEHLEMSVGLRPDGKEEIWLGNNGEIQVVFDDKDRVLAAYFERVRPLPESFFGRLRRWAGLAAQRKNTFVHVDMAPFSE